MSDSIQDPENYGRMARPYDTQTDAVAALNGFLNEVLLLRQKWRIPEVVVGCAVYFGEDNKTMANYHRMGNFMISPLIVEQLQARITRDLLDHIDDLDKALKEQENESGAQIPLIDPEAS